MERDREGGLDRVAIKLTRELVGKAKSVAEEFEDVAFLAIVGSVATRGVSFHDVDFAVKAVGERKYDTLCKLALRLSEALGVPGELIDVVDIDRADIDFKARVAREGVVVVDRGYLSELRAELSSKYWEHREYLDVSLNEWLRSPDPSAVDAAAVKRRLDFIREEVEFLEEHVLSKSIDEVESSPVLRRLLERGFQLVVEATVDTCRHIASAKGWLREYTAGEAVSQCAKRGVISEELARTLSSMIVHRYLEVDHKRLYLEAEKLKDVAREFEGNVVKYLKSEAKRR